MHFIPKPGKDDYTNPRAYRPISIVSFLFKALERVVLWHIEDDVLINNPLNKISMDSDVVTQLNQHYQTSLTRWSPQF